MLAVDLTVHFPGQYVGHPYRFEMFRLIEIIKKSGMSRARSGANARKALEEHLRDLGMTFAEYEALSEAAKVPFDKTPEGFILIPAERVLSFFVATFDTQRAAQRPCPPGQVRSRFTVTDWTTTKTQEDGIWRRFATVASGTGAKLSNQRGLREDEFIADFSASGSVRFDETFVKPDVLRRAIEWGGEMVGIGASRKMGKGRFRVTHWSQRALPAHSDLPLAAE